MQIEVLFNQRFLELLEALLHIAVLEITMFSIKLASMWPEVELSGKLVDICLMWVIAYSCSS